MESKAQKKRVLVVDHSEEMRIFLVNLLNANGFRTVAAKDEAAAMNIVESYIPDLIILDPILPNEQGINIYINLKRDRKLSPIPIIIFSSISHKTFSHLRKKTISKTGKDFGDADAFIEKPPEADEILVLADFLTANQQQ